MESLLVVDVGLSLRKPVTQYSSVLCEDLLLSNLVMAKYVFLQTLFFFCVCLLKGEYVKVFIQNKNKAYSKMCGQYFKGLFCLLIFYSVQFS